MRSHAAWVDEALHQEKKGRDAKWTETIAIGSKAYADLIKEKLGPLFLKRRVEGGDGQYELREPPAPFHNTGNTFPWHLKSPALFSPFS